MISRGFVHAEEIDASQTQGIVVLLLLFSIELSARTSSAAIPSSSEIVSSSIILVVWAVPSNMSKLVANKTWSICASHRVALVLGYHWEL